VERPHQLPAVGVEAALGGAVDGSLQDGLLGGQPGHRGRAVRQRFRSDLAGSEGNRVAMGIDQAAGGDRGAQIVVEQPTGGLGGVRFRGDLSREGAQQVMEEVAAPGTGAQQIRLDQFGQGGARPVEVDARQTRGRGCGAVRSRMESQQAEQTRRRGAELLVRPPEQRPGVRRRVVAAEAVERRRTAFQLVGEQREWITGAYGRTGGDHGQGERQARARTEDPVDRPGFGGHPRGTEAHSQERPGLGIRHGLDRDDHGPGRGDQPGEPTAARDDGAAIGRTRQQRTHLRRVLGVVEDDEHPLVRQERTEVRGALLDTGRDRVRLRPKGFEEAAQGLARIERRLAGREPAQVDVEPPVRIGVRGPLRPAHRDRGLADPGRSGDDRDGRQGVSATERVQERQLGLPASEGAQVERQLIDRRGPIDDHRGPGRGVEAVAVGQHPPVHLLEFVIGFGAQSVDERGPGVAVDRERLPALARPAEREHQLGGQMLPQRLPGMPGPQLAHQLGMLAQVHPRLDVLPDDVIVPLAQGGAQALEPDTGLDVLIGLAADQRGRVAERLGGIAEATFDAGPPPFVGEAVELPRIELTGLDAEAEALVPEDARRIVARFAKRRTEFPDVAAQIRLGGGVRFVPDQLHEPGPADGLIGGGEQRRQDRALAGPAERHPASFGFHSQWTEHHEAHVSQANRRHRAGGSVNRIAWSASLCDRWYRAYELRNRLGRRPALVVLGQMIPPGILSVRSTQGPRAVRCRILTGF